VRWNYVERKCSVGGKHKLQRPRAANEAATIAALPLGRSALPAPESSAASLNFTGTANAPELTPAVSDPLGSTAPAPKKARNPRLAGTEATICRATGTHATTDGALALTLYPTTATGVVAANGYRAVLVSPLSKGK
jgi:hypothetical protein